ncbi:MAG: hypothetical protein AAFP86_17735 [Planctomycetota bacterium]
MASLNKLSFLPAALAFAAPALAQTNPIEEFDADVIPSFRGAVTGEYAGWDTFTIPFGGPNFPDDMPSPLVSSLTQATPGAIIASSGNLYNPAGVSSFDIEFTAQGVAREVILQTDTIGFPLDAASFTFTYDDGGTDVTIVPTDFQELIPWAGGFGVNELYVAFDLTTIPTEITGGVIEFDASGGNSSLTAVMLDVRSSISVGTNFCAAVPNSTGAIGNLEAIGSPFVADQELALSVSNLPLNTFGIYVVSPIQANNPMTGGVGTLCLGGSIGRFAEIYNSGDAGADVFELDLMQIPNGPGFAPVAAGDTLNFQAWHRDVAGGAQTSNFTEAVTVDFQ